jgi:hypothetical protein
MNVICITLKTISPKPRVEHLSTAADTSTTPPGGTGAMIMAGTTSYWLSQLFLRKFGTTQRKYWPPLL